MLATIVNQIYCDVIVPFLIDTPLTYALSEPACVGQIVKISWRNKPAYGLVVAIDVTPPENVTLKEATPLSFSTPKAFVKFVQDVASYNLIPLGWVWRMVLGSVDLAKVQHHDILSQQLSIEKQCLKALTPTQQEATHTINKALNKDTYASFLLDGVTGSGKTEVYFHVIAQALKQGKQCLILLPEIGLSHQWLQRFEEQFGYAPLLWHSHTTPKKRLETWSKAISGTPHVFVGARSALFLPYQHLGLIVVDEEHDGSYKQEEQGAYNARDMAILRASLERLPIILASATPSLESFVNVEQGKSMHLHLPSRFGAATLPRVHLVDRRIKGVSLQTRGWLSDPLKAALTKRLGAGEQSLLFLNRRGYAPITLCASCGYQYECPGCSASLVQHRHYHNTATLQCHHCGFVKPLDPRCPECFTDDSLVPCGPGIDRVKEDMEKFFPKARIASLTSDMTPKQQRETWQAIHDGSVDIIIGTQLISKGHHLPNLTLVGIVDADMGLRGGDLRGGERTFQLLQQVSGRSGRDVKPGEVYLQTFQPENPLFKALQGHDRDAFVTEEQAMRQEMHLPPFTRLVSLVISGVSEETVQQHAKLLATYLNDSKEIYILGPAPAIMLRLKSRYRYRLLLKAEKRLNISRWLKEKLAAIKIPSSLKIHIDIDPVNFT